MGRKQQEPRTSSKVLKPAWLGWPRSKDEKYHLEFRDAKSELLRGYHKFAEAYAAKKFLEAVIGTSKTEWVSDEELLIGSVTVRGVVTPLEEIMEHEYTQLESSWELPIPYPNYARIIAGLPFKIEGLPPADVAKSIKKEKREHKPRASKDGLVTVQEICTSLKMDPREARQILRAAKTVKPDAGWAWPKDEAPKIEQLLRKGKKK